MDYRFEEKERELKHQTKKEDLEIILSTVNLWSIKQELLIEESIRFLLLLLLLLQKLFFVFLSFVFFYTLRFSGETYVVQVSLFIFVPEIN